MIRPLFSLTSLLMLLGVLLPQISAGLGGMPLPDDVTQGAQALERGHQAGSSTGPRVDQGSAEQIDQPSGAQIEPRQGIRGLKSATCNVYPMTRHWKVIVDFWNWDPDKDGKAQEFEKVLQEKCGEDNVSGFWWKKFPSESLPNTLDTRFTIDVPYPAPGRMKGDMYELVSDAIFQYSGKAKIRVPCYLF